MQVHPFSSQTCLTCLTCPTCLTCLTGPRAEHNPSSPASCILHPESQILHPPTSKNQKPDGFIGVLFLPPVLRAGTEITSHSDLFACPCSLLSVFEIWPPMSADARREHDQAPGVRMGSYFRADPNQSANRSLQVPRMGSSSLRPMP